MPSKYTALSSGIILSCMSVPSALGQADDGRRVIEEIVVTAQKREQRVEDVPISISVIEEELIAAHGFTDIRDAMLFAPNVQIETTTLFTSPRCRGFSVDAGRNRAFEPPCGLALNGVPYTRPAYFQGALFDLKRIEVLRGPQGTTFGKNTTAGLISLVTNDPTDEVNGHVEVQYGELERQRFEAAIGGPVIADFLNVRIAGLIDEQDGFLTNTTARIVPRAEERSGDRKREGIRAKLGFPSLFGSQLTLAYEHLDLESRGSGAELTLVYPATMSILRSYDPDTDFEPGNLVTSEDEPSGAFVEIDTFQADWSYEPLGWGIDAVAAHSILENRIPYDGDRTPSPAFFTLQEDTNPTTTVEVRALSPSFDGLYGLERLFGWALGRSDLLAGVFYQRQKFDPSELLVEFRDVPFVQLLAGQVLPGGIPPLPPALPTGEDIAEQIRGVFEQDAETIAGFGQFQWYFTERWMLQFGMRLSNETKDAAYTNTVSDPAPVAIAAGFEEFSARPSVSEFQLQPKVTLNYEPFEGVSLFAHWARGFKGGGFNSGAFRAEALSFDPEAVEEWGIDAKMRLLDGAASINLSLFRMDVEDFQVFTFTSDEISGTPTGSLVLNAPEARAQGVEADLTYLPTDWLTVIGTVGLNDTEYVDFPNGPCADDMAVPEGCDLSGRPFPFTPEWRNTFTMIARYPLAGLGSLAGGRLPAVFSVGGIELVAGYTLEFIDVQYLDDDVDPRKRQSSFFRLRANLGFGNPAQGWSLQVIGENLTDERTAVRTEEFLENIWFTIPEPPRLFFGQFRWAF